MLIDLPSLVEVAAELQFPPPTAFVDNKAAGLTPLPAFPIRDAPRFIPSEWGAVPPAAAGGSVPPELASTSGFDTRNTATDVYIFLPGAAAAVAAVAASAAAESAAAAEPAAGAGNDGAPALPAASSAQQYGYAGLRSEYLRLTGPIPSLPDQAFGTWFSWYHPYTQAEAETDIKRWRSDDLPLDIWGLDMNWRVTANGEEGKCYCINTDLFPNMTGFMDFAHKHGLVVYMNDHPMQHAPQLSPAEVQFRWDGMTSLFDHGLDFWWYVTPIHPITFCVWLSRGHILGAPNPLNLWLKKKTKRRRKWEEGVSHPLSVLSGVGSKLLFNFMLTCNIPVMHHIPAGTTRIGMASFQDLIWQTVR